MADIFVYRCTMNLPGYNYLGPGNPLFNGPPRNYADRMSRKHDFAYSRLGKQAYWRWSDADARYLNSIKNEKDYGAVLAKGYFGLKKLLTSPFGTLRDPKKMAYRGLSRRGIFKSRQGRRKLGRRGRRRVRRIARRMGVNPKWKREQKKHHFTTLRPFAMASTFSDSAWTNQHMVIRINDLNVVDSPELIFSAGVHNAPSGS